MIFRNITDKTIDCYGYSFQPGVDVEVTEPNLVSKFSLYHQFECFIEGESIKEPELTRDELKAKADEMGIEYSPRTRTETLRGLVS